MPRKWVKNTGANGHTTSTATQFWLLLGEENRGGRRIDKCTENVLFQLNATCAGQCALVPKYVL